MTITVTPHLNFRGEARAALDFYHLVFGGDLMVATYEDMGNVQVPAEAKQVMYGQVAAPSGFQVMAYDVPSSRDFNRGEGSFFVSVRGTDIAEVTASWDKLADGAAVLHPLGPAPWAPLYGMLKDKFGITWVVDVAAEQF